jgi:hypothetical protein
MLELTTNHLKSSARHKTVTAIKRSDLIRSAYIATSKGAFRLKHGDTAIVFAGPTSA